MGAWIEIQLYGVKIGQYAVAPVWGRGLKSEIIRLNVTGDIVAPVWGRGLKSRLQGPRVCHIGRPRMGAWIEIPAAGSPGLSHRSPPYGGVD